MTPYKKPTIVGYNSVRGIFPLAAIGAAAASSAVAPFIAGAGAAALGAAALGGGAAAGAGVGAVAAAGGAAAALAGIAVAKKLGRVIDFTQANALTERKNFALE